MLHDKHPSTTKSMSHNQLLECTLIQCVAYSPGNSVSTENTCIKQKYTLTETVRGDNNPTVMVKENIHRNIKMKGSAPRNEAESSANTIHRQAGPNCHTNVL